MWRVIAKMALSIGACGVLMIYYPLTGVGAGKPPGERAARPDAHSPACKAPSAVVPTPLPSPAGGGQMQHDGRTQATFFMQFTGQGTALLTTRVGELAMEKVVAADGRTRITLRAGQDEVGVTLGLAALEVTHNNRSMHVELGRATEDDLLNVNQLLAGSKAIRLMRTLAANLDDATLRKPAGVATLLVDAIVGVLAGDVAAVDRLARRFASHKQIAVRLTALDDGGPGCYEKYEAEVNRAWDDYLSCLYSVGYNSPWAYVCGVRWITWAESAWFSFISCAAFPLKDS